MSGWVNVARFFSLPLPAWVKRWGARNSKFEVQAGTNIYYIFAENITSNTEKDKIQRMADVAMNMQANNMTRILEDYIKKEAARRGFVTR
jgi:hypothetical protein